MIPGFKNNTLHLFIGTKREACLTLTRLCNLFINVIYYQRHVPYMCYMVIHVHKINNNNWNPARKDLYVTLNMVTLNLQ